MSSVLLTAPRAVAVIFMAACASVLAQEPPANSTEETAAAQEVSFAEVLDKMAKWSKGPAAGPLGGQSTIQVPAGFRFTEAAGTRSMMEQMENPTSGNELGMVGPDDLEWFVVFEFDDVGYVKDDEKDKLDADAMLNSIKESNKAGNAERRRRGWGTIEVVGWAQPPTYDPETNNLTWATRARDEQGHESINYNTRLLGRHGVMEVTLVCGPDEYQAALPAFKKLLQTHEFNQGQRYAEFRQGDKIAQYGLTALIAGGAAAVALKTGVLQKFWKLIAFGVLAIGAAIAKVGKSIFGRRQVDTR